MVLVLVVIVLDSSLSSRFDVDVLYWCFDVPWHSCDSIILGDPGLIM